LLLRCERSLYILDTSHSSVWFAAFSPILWVAFLLSWQCLLHNFFFSFAVPGLELRAYALSHSTSPFCVRYFWDRVLRTICPGWLQTVFFLVSASRVARITGVSHWRPTVEEILYSTLSGLGTLAENHLAIHIGFSWTPNFIPLMYWCIVYLSALSPGPHGSQNYVL
jgi:hypothetical protein